jgi:LCP family protein required for cell wall assembly
MTDEFETLLTDALADRAQLASRGAGFSDVRHRVRRRRQRRVALVVVPSLAGVAYFAGRPGAEGHRVGSNATASTEEAAQGSTSIAGSLTSTSILDATATGLEPQNFLIVGAEANACVDPSSPWAGAADPTREGLGARSDTIVVLRLEPATGAAAMLSFPRDLWVDITGRGKGRINSAYVENDYSVLAQTIYDNFGIVVDHYIQIDFCALKRIVDAVGGVGVPFSTRVMDRNVGLDVGPGCHTFTGDEALEDSSADLGRISRQQDFIRRTLATALAHGLFDPTVARALIESLQSDVVTEAGFTVDDMLGAAATLGAVDPAAISMYQIEVKGMTVGGASVLLPQIDSDTMKNVLSRFRGAESPSDSPTTEPATTHLEVPSIVKGDILPDPNASCG